MRRNMKKLTALTLTAAMTMASAMTAFAANSGDYTGNGDYEGEQMKYPAIKVTVPLTAEIDYIADPNDLIKSTLSGDVAAKQEYEDFKFSGDTGVYFKTKDASGDPATGGEWGLYSEKSEVLKFINESAQDVTMTVTLSKTSEASGDVVYSDTAAFGASDKDKKLYLALTDGTSTEALGATDAIITTNLTGQPTNFEPNYDDFADKYQYKLKDDLATDWTEASYELTGAVNKNAKWDTGVGFPNIKVTYSYVEAPSEAAPSIATTSYKMSAGQTIGVTVDFGKGDLGATAVSRVVYNSKPWTVGKHYTVSGNRITITSATVDYLLGLSATTSKATVVFDNGDEVEISLNK